MNMNSYSPPRARRNAEEGGEKPLSVEPLNSITQQIIGAAMRVHSRLGPGLLESTYEVCLAYELRQQAGIKVLTQLSLPISYDSIKLDAGYRVDLLVNDAVIVEIKAVDEVHPIHEAQLLTYLKLSGKRLGLLLNFNVEHMRDGIHRRVLKL
jgi:GxxExxY protein